VFRPVLTMPRPPELGEAINWLVVGSFDVALAYFYGWRPLIYCLMSSLLGSG
jgi:hypothetical protein